MLLALLLLLGCGRIGYDRLDSGPAEAGVDANELRDGEGGPGDGGRGDATRDATDGNDRGVDAADSDRPLDGDAGDSDVSDGDSDASSPSTVLRVSVGLNANACAVLADSSLWCWGASTNGLLGTGATSDQRAPSRVGPGYRTVSVGNTHACAIDVDGALFCWGANDRAQLGKPVSIEIVETPEPTAIGMGWREVSCGSNHTCAIRDDGALYCWGSNIDGELGLGSVGGFIDTPMQVGGDLDWVAIEAGATAHTCGRRAGGVECWGSNSFGVVGVGMGPDEQIESPQAVSPMGAWLALSARNYHACGVRDGALYCWGSNSARQLGTIDYDNRYVPTFIETSVDVAAVATGEIHTCVIRVDGFLYCVGADGEGQQGNGPTLGEYAELTRVNDEDWASVDAGRHTTCATRRSDQSVWCWGYNQYGQAGVASDENVIEVPTLVTFP